MLQLLGNLHRLEQAKAAIVRRKIQEEGSRCHSPIMSAPALPLLLESLGSIIYNRLGLESHGRMLGIVTGVQVSLDWCFLDSVEGKDELDWVKWGFSV